MIVAVVLGNRLNDDGSITDKMRCRIELASEIHKTLLPCKMVLSGGVANPLAGKSEAQAMFDILVAERVPENVLIREEKSLTTKQNAHNFHTRALLFFSLSAFHVIVFFFRVTDFSFFPRFLLVFFGCSRPCPCESQP